MRQALLAAAVCLAVLCTAYGQAPKTTAPSAAPTIISSLKYNNFVFYVLKGYRSWQDAQTACQQAVPGGNLVTFTSYDDYSVVSSKLANVTEGTRPSDAGAFWTGAMLTSGGRSMQWADGSPITFAAFLETAPFPVTGAGQGTNTCVLGVYDGKAFMWINTECSHAWPAVCRARAASLGSPPPPTPPPPQRFPPPPPTRPPPAPQPDPASQKPTTIFYGGSLYYIVPGQRSYADAEQVCGMVDGHLASFKSPDEYNTIVERLVGQTEAGPKRAAAFWLGATAKIGTRLANVTFIDNTPVQWLQNFWNGGIIGDPALTCILAMYNGKDYLWMNANCNVPYPSVCKRSLTPTRATPSYGAMAVPVVQQAGSTSSTPTATAAKPGTSPAAKAAATPAAKAPPAKPAAKAPPAKPPAKAPPAKAAATPSPSPKPATASSTPAASASKGGGITVAAAAAKAPPPAKKASPPPPQKKATPPAKKATPPPKKAPPPAKKAAGRK